jgi:predicted phage replisome organizer
MAEVKWIKLKVGMFDGMSFKKIKRAEIGGVKFRDKLTAVWFELMDFAGRCNHNGAFISPREIPFYELSDIATMIDRDEEELRLCINFFINEGMVSIVDDVYVLSNWSEYQNIDGLEKIKEQNRLRQAKYKERQKLLLSNVTDNVTVTEGNATDIDIEKDKDKEVLPKGNTRKKPSKSKYGEYGNVLLTDNEYENLANTHGIETRDKAIKFLDEYIEEKGYKSKSHNLAIRRWVFEAVERQKETEKKQGSFNTESFYNAAVTKSLGGRAAMEREASARMENKSSPTAEEDPFLKERAENLKKLIGG